MIHNTYISLRGLPLEYGEGIPLQQQFTEECESSEGLQHLKS